MSEKMIEKMQILMSQGYNEDEAEIMAMDELYGNISYIENRYSYMPKYTVKAA